MGISLTTAAVVQPVTLAEMKSWLKLDSNDEDATVAALISAATAHYEKITRRQLVNATWALRVDAWPVWSSWLDNPYSYGIRIPRSPLSSVTQIQYVDPDGTLQVLATSVYESDTGVEPGIVRLKFDQSWPAVRWQKDAISVTFVSGYGPAASNVPETHKTAIKFLVAHWYENREGALVGSNTAEFPEHLKSLVEANRVLEAA